jgi:glycosyltransferase involved in cell wall biosynthesis/GT2 family glycosyltransferase
MNRILIITITPNSAVDRLAEMVKKHNEHLDIDIFPFHPKRYSESDLKIIEEKLKWADLIDFEYWKAYPVLVEKFPWIASKKKILTHHNPYDLDKLDPTLFNSVVVKNKTQQNELLESVYIPHAVDLDFFQFNKELTDKPVVGMVAFRIESKKGIKSVAQACKNLGYKFLLVGHVSRPEYFQEILDTGVDLDFREDVSDEDLRKAYYEMGVLVVNSVDGFESGTMPLIEAMACGVPIITRNIGLVPDIYNEKNMIVRHGLPEGVTELEYLINNVFDDKEKTKEMRMNGWDTVKNLSDKRMAVMYANLYNQVLYDGMPLVSVIIPTYNRSAQVVEIINALNESEYPNIEIVVCDDDSDDGTENTVKGIREISKFSIKYVNTNREYGYNLAMARNFGIIESEGEFIVFLDSRFKPDKFAVTEFVKKLVTMNQFAGKKKVWAFGDKGANKKSFVENFSAIRRHHIVQGGMFNERITMYGGMSQELRERFTKQGFEFVLTPEAKAEEIKCASKKIDRLNEIKDMKFLLWKFGYRD